MKKLGMWIAAACVALALAGCGESQAEPETTGAAAKEQGSQTEQETADASASEEQGGQTEQETAGTASEDQGSLAGSAKESEAETTGAASAQGQNGSADDADETEQETMDDSASEEQGADRGTDDIGTEGVKEARGAQDIDVDLTQLSSTMVYSEVYNMMYTPQDYIGKTVKMNGTFTIYGPQADGTVAFDPSAPIYYACVIKDAAACCAQGLEFVLQEEYAYPEDYPQVGDEITVVGTFETYEENGGLYCRLANAKMPGKMN